MSVSQREADLERENSELSAQVDALQQERDEIIVALGSEGLQPSEIVERIKHLRGLLQPRTTVEAQG